MKRSLRGWSAIACGAVACANVPASAAGIFQFTFEGDATLVGTAPISPPTVPMTTWSLTYTFDAADPGSAGPAIPGFQIRTYEIISFAFEFNGVPVPFDTDVIAPDEGITVTNALAMPSGDAYSVELDYASATYPIAPNDPGIETDYGLNLLLVGPASIFTSDALPTNLALDDFSLVQGGSLTMDLFATTALYDLTITDFTSRKVPTPGAMTLLICAGLITLGPVHRRRH